MEALHPKKPSPPFRLAQTAMNCLGPISPSVSVQTPQGKTEHRFHHAAEQALSREHPSLLGRTQPSWGKGVDREAEGWKGPAVTAQEGVEARLKGVEVFCRVPQRLWGQVSERDAKKEKRKKLQRLGDQVRM